MRKWKVHQASLCDTSHSSLCITRTTWSSHCSNKWRAAPDSDGCVVTWNNHIIVVIRYELELAPTASDLCQGYVYFTHPNQSYAYFKLHQTSDWIWPMGWWHSFSEASPAALSVSSCSQSWLVVINILHAQRSSNDWNRSFKPLMEYPHFLWFRDLETNTPAYQKTSWLASSCHFEPQNVSQFNQEINYIPYISIYQLYVHGDFILGKFVHQHTFKLWLNPCATMFYSISEGWSKNGVPLLTPMLIINDHHVFPINGSSCFSMFDHAWTTWCFFRNVPQSKLTYIMFTWR